MATTKTIAFTNGVFSSQDFPIETISDLLKSNTTMVSVDFTSPSESDLSSVAKELGLHELAVEDALHSHQRPKIDYYADHIFLACHSLKLNIDTGELQVIEIDSFIQSNCMITVHGENFSMDEYTNRWANTKEVISVSFLLYSLLDSIIDQYIDTVSKFDDFFDSIGERIFSGEYFDITSQKEWFNMRKSLVQFHRVISSMREALSVLIRRENHFIDENMVPYFHDLHDHLIRVYESSDVLRELVATISETNLNLRDYRQNQIVKQVTSWAAIVAVPTLVTGFYGMNVPFPGSGETSGVFVASGLGLSASLLLFWIFRKRDWI
ncbi:MAG: magnesium transporter CorA family protein [Acidimicrobiia bacterium]|nr:magnesium transporter CorA family protein [Acidimicrobiia bacterium]